MAERTAELRAILATVKSRWSRRAFLRAWMLGASTAGAMLLVGLLAVWLLAHDGIPLVFVVATVGLIAGIALSFAFVPLRRQPTDRQIARFIEEGAGGLDEILVTAVDKSEQQAGPVVDLLVADAIRAARDIDPHRLVTRESMSRAAIGGLIGTAVFAISFAFFAPSASRAINVAGAYLLPSFYAIDVTPGSIKVREGQPVTVTARIEGLDGGIVPEITVGKGEASRSARMAPSFATATDGKSVAKSDEFTITLNNITGTFPYHVTAGSARSSEFTVELIRPVRVTQIDVTYLYAPGLGLESHTEEDGGDIFAPSGTKVQLKITTDKAVSNGELKLVDGSSVALSGHNQVFTADLTVTKDGSYRIALNDVDGMTSAGETEYFIRMLNDRPPDVRIMRPAGDKQVSPLEEVPVEARADDDYGVRSLELVIKSAAGKEKVIALAGAGKGTVATGEHTVFLEDLNVKPGDVVTYYARATDVGRGRRSTESRSDIYFLEVKPYEEEFVSAESQAGGNGGDETGLEELIAQQKDIMAATWKLDARARRGGGAQSTKDIEAIAGAQFGLKMKTQQVSAQMTSALQAQRRRQMPQTRGLARAEDEPLPKAIDEMDKAVGQLNQHKIATSLPHEEQALAQLLKAAAEIRRRQIAMQQANGGGGNGNRNQPDLSTLFDQELRKKQQTNYEQQSTTEDNTQAQNEKKDDPLEAIRELARRQEALSKQQRDLAKNKDQMTAEEMKRQLERLTRDQEELRKQAEEMAKQQQGGQGARGAQGTQGASNSEKLRDAAEQMRQAAGDLRNQDPQQASNRGSQAGQQLRGVEQQMQGARPEERRRAMGDLQLEARQIADAQRRLGNEASRTAPGNAGDDARRRLAGEQERLADRTQRLGDSVKQMASGEGDKNEQQAMAGAGRELEKQNVAGRMRESAQSMKQGQPSAASEEIAGALDKIADQLASANGTRDAETEKLSSQLSRAQELRDRVSRLQRSMDELKDAQGAQGAQGASGSKGSNSQSAGNAEGTRDVAQMQRDIDQQMKDAQKLAEQLQRGNPEMQKGGTTPEQWQRSVSAPGTEAFKQDFSKWEELKKNLLVALDQTETKLSDQLRARENRERLNAGRHDGVADTYRELVDRYYQSLASPRTRKH